MNARPESRRPAEVIGVGAATWDHFWIVEDFAAGERVCAASDHVTMGGGPVATALCTLARHGHSAALIDVGGDDPPGIALRDELARHGVDTTALQVVPGRRSATAGILVRRRDGARQIAYHPSDAGEPVWGETEARRVRGARLLHLNGRHETAARAAVAEAGAHGVEIAFDGGAGRWRESLRDLVTASQVRLIARDFARHFAGSDDLETMIAALLTPPARVVVITDGVRGSHLALPDGTRHHQPAFPANPLVDTTGCGDVFHGAFLHGWLSGWPKRSSGGILANAWICSSVLPCKNSCVATGPGAMALTVICRPRSSLANTWVSDSTAALLAMYTA